METIDLIKKLEIISSKLPNRVLRIKGIFIDNEELIEVIKENTEPTCYERPEHNS